jgi:hypothetical protein
VPLIRVVCPLELYGPRFAQSINVRCTGSHTRSKTVYTTKATDDEFEMSARFMSVAIYLCRAELLVGYNVNAASQNVLASMENDTIQNENVTIYNSSVKWKDL